MRVSTDRERFKLEVPYDNACSFGSVRSPVRRYDVGDYDVGDYGRVLNAGARHRWDIRHRRDIHHSTECFLVEIVVLTGLIVMNRGQKRPESVCRVFL